MNRCIARPARDLMLLVTLVLLATSSATGVQVPPEPGISQALAESRAARISDLRYRLQLSVAELTGEPIEGVNTLRFQLKNVSEPLVIDFATSRKHVKSVRANGADSPFEWVNGHIVVPSTSLAEGNNEIAIGFIAGDASLNRNPDFLYALFVPARAHLAIPVFDQPDLKARWSLSISAPPDAKWQIVSNGSEPAPLTDEVGFTNEVECSGEQRSAVETCWKVVTSSETEPLPTYLFSFVIGNFQIETAERNGRTFRMFHRETDAAKVTRNKDAIFNLHASALAFMEDYTGIPYAFGKFDFVLIPAFQFGGMEHAGKILYNAPGLLLDESATQNQYLGRASVIAHETAHMWFGDLVTMRWFNDVWMKEVFANFMAAKIVNPSFPDVDHELRFLLSHYPAAYEVDRTPGANAIRQELGNLNEAGSLYGAIIYQKAPVIMRHLEAVLGEQAFRDGLREYLKAHAFGNATWRDLIAVLDRRTPRDLAEWSRIWVETAGRPTLTTELEIQDGKVARLAFRQTDAQGRNLVWPQELRVTLGRGGERRELKVAMESAVVEVAEARGLAAPDYVLPNGEGWAYGGVVLDQRSLDHLATSLPSVPDPLTRGSAWIALWEALLDGRLAPTRFVDLAAAALPRETDEQMTARVLGQMRDAWWRFLPETERRSRQTAVEVLLRRGLDEAPTASRKGAWFAALRSVAATDETLTWLRRVWNGDEKVEGLPLAEPDLITLALELAVREVPGWREVLSTQHARTQNPDRKARFAFVMPALSADPAERDRWFASLEHVENRRREPWVLEGLSYLHHPLRTAASAKHVPKTLAMLHEIQRTGDIFFPKRWLDATLGGHNTPQVAAHVRAFLEAVPADYPARLKSITLQSADELFRSAAILGPRE